MELSNLFGETHVCHDVDVVDVDPDIINQVVDVDPDIINQVVDVDPDIINQVRIITYYNPI